MDRTAAANTSGKIHWRKVCRKLAAATHADYKELRHLPRAELDKAGYEHKSMIDYIRNEIINWLAYPPLEGRHRALVIPDPAELYNYTYAPQTTSMGVGDEAPRVSFDRS